MMIACDSCQSKYSVADEKVRGKTVRIRCRECQATIVVTGPSVSSAPAAAAAYEPQFSSKSSQAPAAIAKRGGARVNRDFAAEARSEEAPSFDRSNLGATASRNENSVLFTLAGLTRKPLVVDTQTAPPDAVNSGLIDLNGMTAATGGRQRSVIQPLFGSSAPLGPVTMEVDHAAPQTNRRNLFLGMGAAAALLAIIGLGFGMSGSSETKTAANAAGAAVAAAPTPAPQAAAPKPADPVAAPTPASDATPASPTTSRAVKGKNYKKGEKASGGWTVKSATPKAAPKTRSAPVKAKGGTDACGCNGELMCLMRCSK